MIHDIIFTRFFVLVINRSSIFYANNRGIEVRTVNQWLLTVLIATDIRKQREHVVRAVFVDRGIAYGADNYHGIAGVPDKHDHETG